jgi:predicted negative regulator of RcsB-dependent stress response
MAAFDLQEQEQIASLKAFWSRWGTLVTTLVVGGVLAFLGNKGWQYWQVRQGQQAFDEFAAVERAFEAGDLAKTSAAAKIIANDFPGTALAARAQFLVAKAAFDAGKLDEAKAALQWVIDQSKEDALVDTARLRLSAVLLDQKQYDAALQVLAAPKVDSFKPLFADARGDAYTLKGDVKAARSAYEEARSKLDATDPARRVIDLKLSALGA